MCVRVLLLVVLGVYTVVCQECKPCEIGEQYQLLPCNATHPAVCANCTVCAENEYEMSECDTTHDTECRGCSTCTPGVSFAVGTCGPEDDRDIECRACSRCASGEFEMRPCNSTHDTLCGVVMQTARGVTDAIAQTLPQTTTPSSPPPSTILSLSLTSDLPASAFTADMLRALSNAFASALNLPPADVEVLGIQRRRLLADLTVDLLIRTPLQPAQIGSINLSAVAQTSGLPIVIRSMAVVPERVVGKTPTTTPPPPKTTSDKTITTTLAIVGSIIGFFVLVAIVLVAIGRQNRVAHDDFTDIDLVSATITHESPSPFVMPRLSRYNL